MLKSQVLLTIGAIILVVLIFFLPKSVVNDESDTVSDRSSMNSTDSILEKQDGPRNEGVTSSIEASVTASDQQLISTLRESFKNSTNKEKSAKFADSLASVYARLGIYDSAGWYYQEAANNFSDVKYWKRAGETYYEAYNSAVSAPKANDFAVKTREAFSQVLEKNPEDADAKVKMAMTYISSPQPMQGIQLLRDVLKQDPDNEQALYNLGVLSMQSNQYKLAVERFEELVKVNPQHLQGQFYLGVSYFELKERSKAKSQFELVKKLDKDPEVQANVDQYLQKL